METMVRTCESSAIFRAAFVVCTVEYPTNQKQNATFAKAGHKRKECKSRALFSCSTAVYGVEAMRDRVYEMESRCFRDARASVSCCS